MFKRFLKYAVVGLQISVLYWGVMYCLTEYLHIWYMFSAVITTVSTSLFGFVMNTIWTWKGHKFIEFKVITDVLKNWRHPIAAIRMAWKSRFIRYYIVGALSILFGWAQTYVYTEYLHLWYIFSSMLGTIVVMTSTFIVRDRWIWRNHDTETT